MNTLYVTVSIPLLLVLAGFNHAHGLTTFGKSNNQNNQPPPQHVQTVSCTSQVNCSYIKGTTCLRNFCLCGDNTHPTNGKCNSSLKAPRHRCETDEECINGADCLAPKVKNSKTGLLEPSTTADYKVCTCQEGLTESQNTCKASSLTLIPGLLLAIALISRTMN